MSRKHYEEIARALCETIPEADARLTIAQALAEIFQRDNVRFNRARFISAVFADQKAAADADFERYAAARRQPSAVESRQELREAQRQADSR